MRSQGILQLDN